ncbi:unnamed protein product [Cuscuta europaea]|uniref:AP2/ERF domain-containing protein n=1 Tax=Cuscuta europaea TaxID=41803 RepID=A0A9P0ZQK9_CUSEU|nr:unnamed protein product [Cuscuta europaea]
MIERTTKERKKMLSLDLAPSSNFSSTANGIWYGLEGDQDNGGFFYDLSDGSLCTMEYFLRSHPQGLVISTPKRDDAAYHRPASGVTLSLDSQGFINHVQANSMHHQQQQHNLLQHINDYTPVESGDFQTLSLSMSPGGSHVTAMQRQQPAPTASECLAITAHKRGSSQVNNKHIGHRKPFDTFGQQRTSQYRGVTRHRWTGRYEAHLWDNSCKKEGQRRKGRQGGYDKEEKAARSYDLAAIKYWGTSTHINFPLENYQQELEEMKNMTRQEYVAHLRRKSTGFSRGASIYRGVTRHHQHGRWQARIGRVAGNKDLYLGTFTTQEEAAEAYDVAAIKFRGLTAVTNFEVSRYDVDRIMESEPLLTGEQARRGNNNNNNTTPYLQKPADAGGGANVVAEDDFRGSCLLGGGLQAAGLDYYTMLMLKTNNDFSNTSSLVNSVQSSREGSPDMNTALPATFPSSTANFYEITTNSSSCSNVNSWASLPPAQMRCPVFAAWSDLMPS